MKIPRLKLPKPQKLVSAAKSNLKGAVKKAQTAAAQTQKKVASAAAQGQKALGGVQQAAKKVQPAIAQAQKTVAQAQSRAGDVFEQGKKAVDQLGTGVTELQKSLGEKYSRLSVAERRFLSTNLHLVKPFSDAADKADALSGKYSSTQFKSAGEMDSSIYKDGAGNALRHATWNALMVKRAYDNPIGGGNLTAAAKKAYEFATAHEDNPKNTIVVNRQMDMHNNSVGRNVALEVLKQNPKATDEEIFKAVVDAFKQGKLREVSGDSLATAR